MPDEYPGNDDPPSGGEPPTDFNPATGEEEPPWEQGHDKSTGWGPDDEPEEEAQDGPEDAPQYRRTIVSIWAVAIVGALAVGVWVSSQNGSEASTHQEAGATTMAEDSATSEAELTTPVFVPVDPSTSPKMGWGWLLRGRASIGNKDVATQYDAYIVAYLDWVDDQQLDESRPKYKVNHARVFFPSVDQAEAGTGCTNTGQQSDVLIFQEAFVTGEHAGFLQFDLTTDPITYKAQLITHSLSRPITHTCPETSSVVDYGYPITWVQSGEVDNTLKGQFRTDYIEFVGTYQSGEAGFTSHFWLMSSCDQLDCIQLELEGDNIHLLPNQVTDEEISWVGADASN